MPRYAELPSIARRKLGPREDSKIEEKDLYFKHSTLAIIHVHGNLGACIF